MEFNDFLSLIKRKKQTIFTIMFVFVMAVILISLASTMKYSVKSRLLVVQNASSNDAYSLSKSNEYLGNLFSEVVYSSSFYDQVLDSKYNVDGNYFSGSYSDQVKKWQKTVSTKTQGDTGIIEINVYHPQVSEANKIALAINDILINNNQNYQGGQNVKINVIDQPMASTYPTKPNLPYNAAAALGGSFLLALFYIYIFPEEKYNLYIFGKRRNKKKINQSDILEKYGNAGYNVNPANTASAMPKTAPTMPREAATQAPYQAPQETNHFGSNDHIPLSGNIQNIINR
jgi:capsular polysaccharide biosynthesis protein